MPTATARALSGGVIYEVGKYTVLAATRAPYAYTRGAARARTRHTYCSLHTPCTTWVLWRASARTQATLTPSPLPPTASPKSARALVLAPYFLYKRARDRANTSYLVLL